MPNVSCLLLNYVKNIPSGKNEESFQSSVTELNNKK